MKLWQAGKKEDAVEVLTKYLVDNQDDLEAYLALSSMLSKMGALEESEKILLSGLATFPNNGDLIYSLGTLYFASEHYPEAIKQFESLKNTEREADADYMLGLSYFHLKDFNRSFLYALTAHDHDPNALDTDQLLADSAFNLGDFNTAQQFYNEMLKLDGRNLHALYRLGLIEYADGDPDSDYFELVKKIDLDYFNAQNKHLADIEKYMKIKKDRSNNDNK